MTRARSSATPRPARCDPDDEERLVLATGRYIGEGFDDARLDTLFLAMPVSWKGTLVQYTGRLHRLHPGKTEVRIFDYVDREVPMLLRMFEKRLRGYRAIGYARGEAPLGLRRARRRSTWSSTTSGAAPTRTLSTSPESVRWTGGHGSLTMAMIINVAMKSASTTVTAAMEKWEIAGNSEPSERGRFAESRLAALLEKAGWQVRRHPDNPGPDLVARRRGIQYAVEVKSAPEGRGDRLVPLFAQAVLQAAHAARRRRLPSPLLRRRVSPDVPPSR